MNLNNLLPAIAFTLLLLLMLAYWLQAAFFGEERYKSLNNFIWSLSLTSLTLLLTVRWIESRHFPLSNLYESLLFLSWCFLSIKLFFSVYTKSTERGKPLYIESFENKSMISTQSFGIALTSPFPEGDEIPLLPKGHGTSAHRVDRNLRTDLYRSSLEATDRSAQALSIKRPIETLQQEERESEQDISLGLGVVLSPAALLTFGFAFLSLPKEMQKATTLVPALQSNWLMMHVTVMLSSYAALLSGSVLSIVFLILSSLEDRKIRSAQDSEGAPVRNLFSNLFYTPEKETERVLRSYGASTLSLTDKLDNYSYRVLALGFPLLTIGILSGAVWANEAWGSYWSWDPKETWALITWLVFAIYLHMRITRGWCGKKSAFVASVGFFVVWFCYLGVNLLGSGLHSYGWFSG